MIKKDKVKKVKNDDTVTIFWYTLKNLDPKKSHPFVIDLSDYCNNKVPLPSSQ
jgi:hypothetical protein